MFFELKLLCPQKEGIFANVWIAATLGIKKLNRNQIINTDIVKTSKEIEEIIITQSHRPKKRLSLRLAAILVNGVTKIYMQQVIILQEEILSFICYIKKPIKVTDESFKKPKSIKSKKRPRPRQITEVAEEQIEIPPESHIRKASDIYYTTSAVEEEAERVKNFGPGPTDWGDEFMRELDNLPQIQGIQKTKDTSAVVETERRDIAEIPERIETEITTLEESGIETTARKEQQDKEGAVPIVETPRMRKTRDEDQIVTLETPRKRKKQQEKNEVIEMDISQKKKQREEDEIVKVETPKKRRRLDYDTDAKETTKVTTLKNIKRKRINFKKQLHTKFIDRIEAHDNELFDKWTFDNVIPNLVRQERENPDAVDFSYLISEFFKYEAEFLSRREARGPPLAGTKSSALEKGSVVSAQKGGRATTPSLEGQPVQLAPRRQLPVIAVITPQGDQDQIISEVVPDAQDIQQLEKLHEKLPAGNVAEAVVQQPIVDEQENARSLQRTRESPIESFSPTENRRKTEEERQKLLAKTIYKWNIEEMGEITIEKICPTPINRRNIAITFSDLLHLTKMGYVKLNNELNSLQLGTIEKGKKLIKSYSVSN